MRKIVKKLARAMADMCEDYEDTFARSTKLAEALMNAKLLSKDEVDVFEEMCVTQEAKVGGYC